MRLANAAQALRNVSVNAAGSVDVEKHKAGLRGAAERFEYAE